MYPCVGGKKRLVISTDAASVGETIGSYSDTANTSRSRSEVKVAQDGPKPLTGTELKVSSDFCQPLVRVTELL